MITGGFDRQHIKKKKDQEAATKKKRILDSRILLVPDKILIGFERDPRIRFSLLKKQVFRFRS
jgi:hypothetical protein